MTEPDDRGVERYLKGGSALSRRYREASRETAPADLDRAVLALARAAARDKRGATRWFAPLALAASALLGVNLAWFLFSTEPVPQAPAVSDASEREESARKQAVAPAAPTADVAAAPEEPLAEPAEPSEADQLLDQAMGRGEFAAGAPAPAAAEAKAEPTDAAAEYRARRLATTALAATAAPSTERTKIEMLLEHVRKQVDATFVRGGVRHTPQQAEAHLRYLLERAGRRVHTAEDFIRLCAAQSAVSSDAYEVQFDDGRKLTAEYFLRRRLKEIENPP